MSDNVLFGERLDHERIDIPLARRNPLPFRVQGGRARCDQHVAAPADVIGVNADDGLGRGQALEVCVASWATAPLIRIKSAAFIAEGQGSLEPRVVSTLILQVALFAECLVLIEEFRKLHFLTSMN